MNAKESWNREYAVEGAIASVELEGFTVEDDFKKSMYEFRDGKINFEKLTEIFMEKTYGQARQKTDR